MLLVVVSSWRIISGVTWAHSDWPFQVHSDAVKFPLPFCFLSPGRRELHSIKGFFSPLLQGCLLSRNAGLHWSV